eukprot:7445110-Alexandrium_andersonii.AAC.1
MAPGRAGSSPTKPVATGGAGEWKQARGERAAWRTQRPLKSAGTDGTTTSGFAREGAQNYPYP